jgi:hypothetical protein
MDSYCQILAQIRRRLPAPRSRQFLAKQLAVFGLGYSVALTTNRGRYQTSWAHKQHQREILLNWS